MDADGNPNAYVIRADNKEDITPVATYITLVTDLCDRKENSFLAGVYRLSFVEKESKNHLQNSLTLCSTSPREAIKKGILFELAGRNDHHCEH